ncbi:hypothetical protein ACFE04_004873 [Oxalis oulophora]
MISQKSIILNGETPYPPQQSASRTRPPYRYRRRGHTVFSFAVIACSMLLLQPYPNNLTSQSGLKTYDHHLLLQEFIHVAIKHALLEEFVYDCNSGSNGDGALIFAPGCQRYRYNNSLHK